MAYDAKDPADKKIVDKLIADAIAEVLTEAQTEHEADKAGLVKKNQELIAANKKLKSGEGDPEEVSRLEAQIETLKSEIKTSAKVVKDLTRERDTHKTAAETEAAAAKNLVVDNSLTAELIAAGVKKEFMPAVKSLLASKVEQTIDGDKRTATVAGKPLSEFVKTWSLSDEGKSFVTAPANGGGNANGGKANEGAKKSMARTAFDALTPAAKATAMQEGTTLTE